MRILHGLVAAALVLAIVAPVAAQAQQDSLQAIRDLFAQYELPEPEENAFPVYQGAFSLMAQDDAIYSYNRNARMGAEPPIAALAANEAALAKLDAALAMGGCLGPKTATFDAQMPWFASAREAARLLCADGLVAETQGDYAKAFKRYCDAVELGQDMGRGGPIIAELVQVAITAIGLRQVRGACLSEQAPEEALAATADRLAALEASDLPVAYTFAYETMWSAEATIDMTERPAGQVPADLQTMAALGAGLNLDGFLAELLDFYTRYIELSKTSYRDTVGLEPAEADYQHPFSKIVLPVAGKVRAKVLSSTAMIRGTRVLVALTRYRLAKGEYPEDLASLVPDYLPELPLDPFSDEPFVYNREPVLSLYSVGENVSDDLGTEKDIAIVPVQ